MNMNNLLQDVTECQASYHCHIPQHGILLANSVVMDKIHFYQLLRGETTSDMNE